MPLNPCSGTLQRELGVTILRFRLNSVVLLGWTLYIVLCNHYRGGLHYFTSLYFSFGISLLKFPLVRYNLFHLSVSCLSTEKISIFWDECNETPVQRPVSAKPVEFSSHEELEDAQWANTETEQFYKITLNSLTYWITQMEYKRLTKIIRSTLYYCRETDKNISDWRTGFVGVRKRNPSTRSLFGASTHSH